LATAAAPGKAGAPATGRWRRTVPDNRTLDADMVQEELGLKLERGKGPVDVIVVEHMELKPTPN
jgi:uncharacterized protein (TIGR03435 family)